MILKDNVYSIPNLSNYFCTHLGQDVIDYCPWPPSKICLGAPSLQTTCDHFNTTFYKILKSKLTAYWSNQISTNGFLPLQSKCKDLYVRVTAPTGTDNEYKYILSIKDSQDKIINIELNIQSYISGAGMLKNLSIKDSNNNLYYTGQINNKNLLLANGKDGDITYLPIYLSIRQGYIIFSFDYPLGGVLKDRYVKLITTKDGMYGEAPNTYTSRHKIHFGRKNEFEYFEAIKLQGQGSETNGFTTGYICICKTN